MGEEVQIHSFLISTLDGGERSDSPFGRVTTAERAPHARRIGGCLGPKAIQNGFLKNKSPSSYRKSEPGGPASKLTRFERQSVLIMAFVLVVQGEGNSHDTMSLINQKCIFECDLQRRWNLDVNNTERLPVR